MILRALRAIFGRNAYVRTRFTCGAELWTREAFAKVYGTRCPTHGHYVWACESAARRKA